MKCILALLALSSTAYGACRGMSSISATQLRCVYPQLPSSSASAYAGDLSSRLSPYLSNVCHWAAFLGNVGTESNGLTEWTQVPCSDSFCGRGPLQITGSANYRYCATSPSCGCPTIYNTPAAAATEGPGMGTAACVWGALSGSSLSRYADGTQNGFLATACVINAGHTPCGTPNGWSSRLAYWNKANACLEAMDNTTQAL